MKRTICLVFCSFAFLMPVAAETDADPSGPVLLELEGIRESLERLVVLLEDAQAGQQAEFLLRRIERKEKRLLPLESRLQDAREDMARLEEEEAEFEGQKELFANEFRDARERGENKEQEAGWIQERLAMREKELESRKEKLELQIRRMEDQVAEQKEEIELQEASLEEMLADLSGSD